MASTYMSCGKVDRYKAINKPRCGCAGCWQKWNDKQQREAEVSLEAQDEIRIDTGCLE